MSQTASVALTELGWIGLLANERGIRAASLPRPTQNEAIHDLRVIAGSGGLPHAAIYPAEGPQAALVNEVLSRLQKYACGTRVDFNDLYAQFDISSGTPWQQTVWSALTAIPYGQTRSYGWVAHHVHSPKASRAVGAALGANPLPIILPCHRVLGSRGELTGYTGGGLVMKRRLLDLESVHQLAFL